MPKKNSDKTNAIGALASKQDSDSDSDDENTENVDWEKKYTELEAAHRDLGDLVLQLRVEIKKLTHENATAAADKARLQGGIDKLQARLKENNARDDRAAARDAAKANESLHTSINDLNEIMRVLEVAKQEQQQLREKFDQKCALVVTLEQDKVQLQQQIDQLKQDAETHAQESKNAFVLLKLHVHALKVEFLYNENTVNALHQDMASSLHSFFQHTSSLIENVHAECERLGNIIDTHAGQQGAASDNSMAANQARADIMNNAQLQRNAILEDLQTLANKLQGTSAPSDTSDQVRKLQESLTEAKKQVQAHERTTSDLQSTLAQLKATQDQLTAARMELAEAKKSTSQAALANAQPVDDQLQAVKTELAQAKTELHTTKVELNTANAELAKAQDHAQTAQTELAKAKTELDTAKAELAKAQAHAQTAQTELLKAQTELANAKADAQTAKDDALKQVQEAQTQLNNAKAELARAQADAQTAKDDALKQLQMAQAAQAAQAELAKAQADALKQLQDAQTQLDNAKAELAKARDKVSVTEIELHTAKAALTEKESGQRGAGGDGPEVDRLRRQLAEAKEDRLNLIADILRVRFGGTPMHNWFK